MIDRVAHRLTSLAVRVLAYLGLFALVVVAHAALTSAFNGFGLRGATAQLASGALVLAFVVAAEVIPRRRRRRKVRPRSDNPR